MVALPVLSWAADPQTTFSTPQEAVKALTEACAHNDTATLLKLFGPDGKDIVESGDRKQDKEGRTDFANLVKEEVDYVADPMNPDKTIFTIGKDDYPFPVPLIRENGQWRFDSASGRQEILARRVGANELSAIEICHGYVEAQFEYAQAHRTKGVPEYAQKILSSPGKQDGLYWETQKGKESSNIPQGFAHAARGMKGAEPYHGYFFEVLKAQGPNATGGQVNYVVNGAMIGGFALIAWPAQYGVSGVQTFIVNHDGNVFEKTLGQDTAAEVQKIDVYNPDASWRPVQ